MFPQFNIYSTPLLILVVQGLVFALLLLKRYISNRNISDLFLAMILIIICYHRTSYTIGFMGWYDTYRTTKINYWLISLTLAIGPVIYFYIRSVTSKFKFRSQDFIHFLPVTIYVVFMIIIFVYDSFQPGFSNTQNGVLMGNLVFLYVNPIVAVVERLQITIYLAFSIQLYVVFRKQVRQYFSNAYSLELNWISAFLFIYAFLFIFDLFQSTIDSFIIELSWKQNWWYHFLSAVAVIFIGTKGYFTDTLRLQEMEIEFSTKSSSHKNQEDEKILKGKKDLEKIMEEQNPYLEPNLNLSDLSDLLGMSSSELSELINTGFGVNFNDYVNAYRIKAFKEYIKEGKYQQLSLVGIALDSGFNSKATFNRAFRKQVGVSPSEYLESQKNKAS